MCMWLEKNIKKKQNTKKVNKLVTEDWRHPSTTE